MVDNKIQWENCRTLFQNKVTQHSLLTNFAPPTPIFHRIWTNLKTHSENMRGPPPCSLPPLRCYCVPLAKLYDFIAVYIFVHLGFVLSYQSLSNLSTFILFLHVFSFIIVSTLAQEMA